MKKDRTTSIHDSELKEEYDFSNGVRGKHVQAYRQGHAVRIHKKDGSQDVHHFSQEDGAIMLDPDVKQHFPDSNSVNQALRSLIAQK